MKRAVLLIVTACVGSAWAFWPRQALSHQTISTTVLFDREIVRILNRRCVSCHSEKNLAFPLTTYEETRPWAEAIREEALRRRMPPWRAVRGYAQFANDNGLTTRELEFIVSWVDGGGPKSAGQTVFANVNAVPKTAGEPVAGLIIDFNHWHLGKPDLLRELKPNIIQPGRSDDVRRTIVDLGLTSDRWVRALEFKPGDHRVVRAAFLTLQETGQWLGAWTPWYGLTSLPDGTAFLVPAGSHVVAEIHYRGADEVVEDRSSFGLVFANAPPANRPSDLVFEARAEVPGDATSQTVRAQTVLTADTYLLEVRTDLGLGAKTMELTARKPDGSTQVLMFLKDILHEWPTPYLFKEPVLLPKNTEVSATVSYANTDSTPQLITLRVTIRSFNKAGRAVAYQALER